MKTKFCKKKKKKNLLGVTFKKKKDKIFFQEKKKRKRICSLSHENHYMNLYGFQTRVSA
jgi:hypothetical protein